MQEHTRAWHPSSKNTFLKQISHCTLQQHQSSTTEATPGLPQASSGSMALSRNSCLFCNACILDSAQLQIHYREVHNVHNVVLVNGPTASARTALQPTVTVSMAEPTSKEEELSCQTKRARLDTQKTSDNSSSFLNVETIGKPFGLPPMLRSRETALEVASSVTESNSTVEDSSGMVGLETDITGRSPAVLATSAEPQINPTLNSHLLGHADNVAVVLLDNAAADLDSGDDQTLMMTATADAIVPQEHQTMKMINLSEDSVDNSIALQLSLQVVTFYSLIASAACL